MMRKLLSGFLFLIATAALQPAMAAESAGMLTARDFARPVLARLSSAAGKTHDSISALCEAPSPTSLQAARDGFGALANAWGHVAVLRFGPLAAESRFERLFFWPDPRGIILKQIQQALAAKEAPAAMSGKSAAVQGIPGLEIVLFADGSESLASPEAALRCRLAAAIAANIVAIASDVEKGWEAGSAFETAFAAPAPGSDIYRNEAEVRAEIVRALATVIAYTRSASLVPPLGDDPSAANGKRAPLWRSRLSFRLISAQIEGALLLLEASGIEKQLPSDQNWVVQSIRFELRNGIEALRKVTLAPEHAFRDEQDRGRIAFANLAFDHAGHLLADDLPVALGLTMGFNALDGD